MSKKFLFIGHDATRTGAPIILLDLARWIKATDPNIEIGFLLLAGGELEALYREIGKVRILFTPAYGILDRVARRLFSQKNLVKRLARTGRKYDAVLGNTIVSLPTLERLKKAGLRTICWAHELDYTIEVYLGVDEFRRLARAVDFFIVPSQAVGEMLDRFDIDTERTVISDFSTSPIDKVAAADLTSYGLAAEAFVVGAAGTIQWRKGVDLFIQAALLVSSQCPAIRFVWVGAQSADAAEAMQIDHDLRRLSGESLPVFIDATPDYRSILAAFDIFALTSRSDASPVVVHEAAKLAKPIFCFADAGGTPEFVGSDAGVIIPYADAGALAAAVIDGYRNPERLAAQGAAAFKKVTTTFSEEASCRAILQILMEQ